MTVAMKSLTLTAGFLLLSAPVSAAPRYYAPRPALRPAPAAVPSYRPASPVQPRYRPIPAARPIGYNNKVKPAPVPAIGRDRRSWSPYPLYPPIGSDRRSWSPYPLKPNPYPWYGPYYTYASYGNPYLPYGNPYVPYGNPYVPYGNPYLPSLSQGELLNPDLLDE
jgi:hypothetical protein